MKGVPVELLKLRASVGYTGNVSFSPYQAMTTYQYKGEYDYYKGIGSVPITIGNPDLTWQRTLTTNVGVDLTMFKGRWDLSLDYYIKNTDQLLLDVTKAPSIGVATARENVGSLENKGLEFQTRVIPIRTKDWYWGLSLNFSHNTNKIKKISNALQALNEKNAAATKDENGNPILAPLPLYEEGQSLTVLKVVPSAGIDPSALEEDLGDDPVKAATYGMRNLAYIVSHLDEWVSGEDNSKRKAKLYEEIAYQGFNYISHVMMNVGGMYLYATSESSGKPRFRVVPKEKQRESVQWLLHQARTFSDLEQPELEQKLYLTGRIYRLVQQQVAHQTMRRINQVALTYYADSTSYHPAEYLEDLYQDVFGPTLRGDTLSETDKDLQLLFADMLLSTVRSIRTSPGALSLHDDEPAFEAFLQRHSDHLCSLTPERESAHQSLIHRNFGNGYGELRDIWPQSIDLSSRYRFQYTQKVRTLVDNALKQGPAQDRAYYTYLSRLIERAMEGKK